MVGIPLQSYLEATTTNCSRNCYGLTAAILEFPLPVSSDIIGKSGLKNMGVAVGISLLSCLEADV